MAIIKGVALASRQPTINIPRKKKTKGNVNINPVVYSLL